MPLVSPSYQPWPHIRLCIIASAFLAVSSYSPLMAQPWVSLAVAQAQREEAFREAVVFDFLTTNREQQRAIMEKITKRDLERELADPLTKMLVDPRVDGMVKQQLLIKLRSMLGYDATAPILQIYTPAIQWQITNRKWGTAYEENFALAAATLDPLAVTPTDKVALEDLIQDALASPDLPLSVKVGCLLALENLKSGLIGRLSPKWEGYDLFMSGQTTLEQTSLGQTPLDVFLAANPPQWQFVYALRQRMFSMSPAGTKRLIQFLESPDSKPSHHFLLEPLSQGVVKSSKEFDAWLSLALRTDLGFDSYLWNLLNRSAEGITIKNRDAAVDQIITYLKSGKDTKGESSYAAMWLLYNLGPLSDDAGRQVEAFLDKSNPIYKDKLPSYIQPIQFAVMQALEGHPLNRPSWKYLHQAVKDGLKDYGTEHHLFVLLSQPAECKADFRDDMLALLSSPKANTPLSHRVRGGTFQYTDRSWIAVEVLLTGKDFKPTAAETALIKSFRSDRMPYPLCALIDQLK